MMDAHASTLWKECVDTVNNEVVTAVHSIIHFVNSLSRGTIIFICFMFLVFKFVNVLYETWNVQCGGSRTSRRHKHSPSNKAPPDIKAWQHNKDKILASADRHSGNFGNCELLYPLTEATPNTKGAKANERVRNRARATGSFSMPAASNPYRDGSLDVDEQADRLDMNHVYIPFHHFLWGHIFVGPQGLFLWGKGVTILWIRKWLCKRGWIKPMPFDPAEIVGRLCLEGTMAIHYYAITKDGNIAGFFFANFPWVDENSKMRIADLFAVDIDLNTKKMVKAKLDDEALTASEAMTFCFFNTIGAQHVKLHSLANWGVNVEPEQVKENPFPARNSLVTVLYNYFGYVSFSNFFGSWKKLGLMDENWDPKALVACFDEGIHAGIWQHTDIHDLVKHSEFVNFVVKLRPIFMSLFEKYKLCFPGVNGEALFVGTVLHSLDHTLMEINMTDPLWLDTDHPKYGLMAELGQVVRVGFIPDVPGLYFHKRYKDSGHPFYDSVYEKAAKINKFLAGKMDTCIIK